MDLATGNPTASFPRVAGVVDAVVPDGSGGWYIGGSFAAVGGLRRSNLAHILSDGRVADWTPDPDAGVLALALSGGTLYVGGHFGHIGGRARSFVAALDTARGQATDWDPAADLEVRALLPARGLLYVGGDFTSIGGEARRGVAALDVFTGQATAWDPDAGYTPAPGLVRTLAAVGDTIYVGGNFWSIGSTPHAHLAAVDATTGLAESWDPQISSSNDSYYGEPYVGALAVRGNSLYFGGHFTEVAGQVRGGLAQVDRSTGQPTAWDPATGPWTGPLDRATTAIALRDTTMLVAGFFEAVGGKPRAFVAEVGLASAAPTDWDPQVNDPVRAVAVDGDTAYLGGTFVGLGAQWRRRWDLAAFDATTGAVKDWAPDPDGLGILSLVVSHGVVYTSGYFYNIGGQPRDGVAALDTLTGAATDWYPITNNWTRTLEIAGDTLFAGGMFTSMNGLPRGRLASFDLATMALTDWAPSANSDIYDLAARGGMVYLAGFFSTVNGISRRYGVAAVDATTGALLDWNPQSDNLVNVIEIVGDAVFVGGSFNTIGGQPRANLAALDPVTGLATNWSADADGGVNTLAVWGDTLFVGGRFSTLAGQPRSGLAALSMATGELLPWNPEFSSVEWASSIPHPIVYGLTISGSTLYVGGLFGRIGTVPANGFVAISFAPPPLPPPPLPTAVALAPMAPNPVHAAATIRYALPASAAVSLSVFDIQGRRVAMLLDHAQKPAGRHEASLDVGRWPRGFYFCLLDAGGTRSIRKFVVLP